MAASSSETPPPPYDEGSNELAAQHHPKASNRAHKTINQTIPKVAESIDREPTMSEEGDNQSVPNTKQTLHNLANQYNKQHTCMLAGGASTSRRKSPPPQRAGAIQQSQSFIDSLKAPRSILNYITIEPLAYLAILALYIEFPSIQDLIYTKLCIQIVANHPNITAYEYLAPAGIVLGAPNLTSLHPFGAQSYQLQSSTGQLAATVTPINFLVNANEPSSNWTDLTSITLPPNGRIQQPQSTNSNNNNNNSRPNGVPSHIQQPIGVDHRQYCDKFNGTLLPNGVRQEIAGAESLFWLKYQLIVCLLCTLSCPYWGGMSDRIGRLIPLNVPIFMATLSNLISLIFGLLICFNLQTLFRIEWLYLGAILIGLSGGQAVLIVNLFSFISDNTSSGSRSKRVVVLESVIYLAHSNGFYISKLIASLGLGSPERPWFNRHFVAFSTCIGLSFICILYSILKLRHHKFHRFLNNFEREQQEALAGDFMSSSCSIGGGTLSRCGGGGGETRINPQANDTQVGSVSNAERLRELTSSTPDDLDGPIARSDKKWIDGWDTILTFKHYKETYLVATRIRESRTTILLLLSCGFISAMCLVSLMSLFYVFIRSDPFNMTTGQYSEWNSITSLTRGTALVGLTLCMKFVKNWNVPDPLVAAIGFLSKGIGLLMIALAQSSTFIYWSLLALVLSEFSMPPIRSLLSKLVVKEEVARVYSCLAAIQSICFLFGNVAFYLAYTSLEFQNFFRLSFIIVAGFQFAAVIIMLFIYNTLRSRVVII